MAPRANGNEDGERASPSGGGSKKEGADGTTEDAAVQPVSGEKSATKVEAASGAAGAAGGGAAEAASGGVAEMGSGGATEAASGGGLGPETEAGTPEHRRWVVQQAAVNNSAAESGDPRGDSNGIDDVSA